MILGFQSSLKGGRLRLSSCGGDLSSLVVGEDKEGMKMEDGGWPGLDRDGWEPLVQRSYYCCFTQPSVAHASLTDLKGDTARARLRWGKVVRVLKVVKVGGRWLKELLQDVDDVDLSGCW